MTTLLKIEGLKVQFHSSLGAFRAVDGVSLTLQAGETLGLVGESGCGKTVTALSVMRLLPPQTTAIEGEISFAGENLLALSPDDMRHIRGNRIAMVFQEPMTSLNPVFTIGEQVAEVLRQHRHLSHREARQEAVEALSRVGLPDAGRRFDQYPHRALRRPAPAGPHGHGPGLRPRAAHRRRAHHRPGRHHSGPDPGSPGPTPGRAWTSPSCSLPITWGWWPRPPTGWR